jgi:hypothetical protein
MRISALTFSVLFFIASPALAQEGINDDWEGTFAGVVPVRAKIADTLRVKQYLMIWIRHDGARRTECRGSLEGEMTEGGIQLTNSPVTWACGSVKQGDTYTSFWESKDHWVLRGTGTDAIDIVFPRVGKKLFVDDLRPRAVQPPVAYGDSVVREVRALYARVNGFPCTHRPYGASEIRGMTICARGDTIGRIKEHETIEAFDREVELTYGRGGELRFAYVQYGMRNEAYRYYFARGRLVRGLVQKEGGENTLWEPSDVNWEGAEVEMLQLAKNCLALARGPFDAAKAEDQDLLDCTVLGER